MTPMHDDTVPLPAQRVSLLCLASLALGILACVPGLGVFAVVFGGFGLYRVANSNDRLSGRGFAVLGIIFGLMLSSVWIAGGVGMRRALAENEVEFARPALAFFDAVSRGRYDDARALLPSTTPVSDEEFRAFDAALSAGAGKAVGPVAGVVSVFGARSLVARFIASDMKDAPYNAGALQFERGIVVVGLRLIPGTPQDRTFLIGKTEALWVGLADGRRIDLVPKHSGTTGP